MTNKPRSRDSCRAPVLTALLILAFGVTCALGWPWRADMRNGEVTQTQPRPVPTPQNPPEEPDVNPPALTPKQQRELLKSRYEKLKQEAAQLSDLAKSLQQDLDKSNSDVLSLAVVDKADKIEKLAKKIKSEAVQ